MLCRLQRVDPTRVRTATESSCQYHPLIRTCSTLAGPTFSGFVVGSGAAWPIEYWYNVGLEGFVIFLILFLLEETGWTRPGRPVYPIPSTSFIQRSIDVYLFRKPNVAEGMTNKETVRDAHPCRFALADKLASTCNHAAPDWYPPRRYSGWPLPDGRLRLVSLPLVEWLLPV